MSDITTIQLKKSTKEHLDAYKRDGENYDSAVARLLSGPGVSFSEEERREIRELARDVAEDVIEAYAHR